MKREEAIKLLKQYQGYEPISPDGETLKHAFDLTDETVDTLLTALRPVSRERMRGEWIAVGAITCKCSRCQHSELSTRANEYLFCPRCGAPMTDEAVDIRLKELEALKDGSTTD